MQWENLTSPDFMKGVTDTEGVGVLPIGVLEAHGAHLPLGQDMLAAHAVACRAAEIEAAIVFPVFPWGINHESAHLSGAVVLPRDLVLTMLENVCAEMARNGLKKVVLYSGHGGNRSLLPLFVQTYLEKRRDYCVYFANVPFITERSREQLETDELGHACEWETSVARYLHEDLVQMEALPDPFTSLERNSSLRAAHVYSPVDWYSMYPTMYVGDARSATAEKGSVAVEEMVNGLAQAIRAIKEDDETPQLMEQIMAGREKPKSTY